MARKKVFEKYADGELYKVQAERPDSFRSGLYLYARRAGIQAKAFIVHTTLPHPTVVFRLGAGPLKPLDGAPERGRRSWADQSDG